MGKTGAEYRAQGREEFQRFLPLAALGSYVLSVFADVNPLNILKDSARKAGHKK